MFVLLERGLSHPFTRIDRDSPLLTEGDFEFTVLHVGRGAVILRPSTGDGDDVVISSPLTGLMPGGLQANGLDAWHLRPPGERLRFVAAPGALPSATRVDLRLGRHDCRPAAIGTAMKRLHRGPRAIGLDVGLDDGAVLAEAALTDDSLAVRSCAERLVGRGVGSTPSGDDLIVGVCAGLRAAGHETGADNLAHVAVTLADRTVRSSRLYLRAATTGRFAERVHRLASGMTGQVEATLMMDALRRWGGSSGGDLAAGFLGAQAVLHGLPLTGRRRGAA